MSIYAGEIAEALTRHFKGKGGMNGNDRFLCGGEVRVSSWDTPRIADFIAQDTWQGGFYGDNPRKHPRHGFEIKISRSDWLAELKQPDKAMAFIPFMHYWSLAIPEGMEIKDGELPETWGLYIITKKGVRVKKSPQENCKVQPMPTGMMISFMRRVAGMEKHRAKREEQEKLCREIGHKWSEAYEEKMETWCIRCGMAKPLDLELEAL